MLNEILKDTESKMKNVVQATKKEFSGIRTGRANPALLERITVDYYGNSTPVTQLASVSVPEARLLVVQPWDKSVLKDIEKAILKSDLGLVPSSDGNVIRMGIPQLTEERRRELVKVVRRQAEEKRVGIRNIRRQAKDDVKTLEKDGEIPEDESRRGQDEIQALTDKYIAEIDGVLAAKEKEIMEL
ncbi:MAG: ribosome recycling factor [Firmicutes bacterium]|nr:ribosome recycling factor [Bacillota bacterium]